MVHRVASTSDILVPNTMSSIELVMLNGVMVLNRVVVLHDVVVLHSIVVLEDALVDHWVTIDNLIFIHMLNLANVMIHVMVVFFVTRVHFLDEHVTGEVVEGLMLDVVFLDHMVAMVVVVLGHRGRLVVDLGVMMDVRCSVVGRRLSLMVAVLVIDDGLVVDAVVMIYEVLFEVMLGLGLLVNQVVIVMMVIVLVSMVHIVIVIMTPPNRFLVSVVMMHSVAMVILSIAMALILMANRVMVLLVVMLIARVLAEMVVASVAELMQLRAMMCIMVIRVCILDMRLVVMNLFTMVRVLVEVDWLLGVDILVLLDNDIAPVAILFMLSILQVVRQEVPLFIGTH